MSVVAEVLEKEIVVRIERAEAIVADLQSIVKRTNELHELSKKNFEEIHELKDALKIEYDHIERITEGAIV